MSGLCVFCRCCVDYSRNHHTTFLLHTRWEDFLTTGRRSRRRTTPVNASLSCGYTLQVDRLTRTTTRQGQRPRLPRWSGKGLLFLCQTPTHWAHHDRTSRKQTAKSFHTTSFQKLHAHRRKSLPRVEAVPRPTGRKKPGKPAPPQPFGSTTGRCPAIIISATSCCKHPPSA